MENILLSIVVAIFLAVGLSIVVLLPLYVQAEKERLLNQSNAKDGALKAARNDLTTEEVAKHNSKSDCWLIVKNKVYDVTEYIDEHPGGERILINAGEDNTKGFYGPQHPQWAYDRIKEYYIGDLSLDGVSHS